MRPEESSFLNDEQLTREQVVLVRFFELMQDEKSRYVQQAHELLLSGRFEIQSSDLFLKYWIKDDLYTYEAILGAEGEKSFVGQVPIPRTEAARIEVLIEMFAQSEAGFIF